MAIGELNPRASRSGDLVSDVPGEHVAGGGILESRAKRHEQVIMVIEIIDGANIEPGRGLGSSDVGASEHEGSGLVEYLGANGQLFRHLPLQEPAEIPVVAIKRVPTMVDPVTATAIGCPIAETLLHPQRKVGAQIAGAET